MSGLNLGQYTNATATIDSGNPAVIAFAEHHTHNIATQREQAVKLYYAIRDSIRYDPYQLELSVHGMKASTCLALGYGWCVSKAVLLAACCRAIGIPARLGFADVRNHLSTERMRQFMQTDIFYWHGYAELWIDAQWVKATPAFNIELCAKFNILPLDFDGLHDSLYHPFDAEGNRHMEYISDRGTYADLPLDEITKDLQANYPMLTEFSRLQTANFDDDVANESDAG